MRIGDPTTHCGGAGTMIAGSSNVIVGSANSVPIPVDDAKKIIDESPTLENQLGDLIEKGYEVGYNESGKVNYVGAKTTTKEDVKKVNLKTQPLQTDYIGEEIPNNPDNWLGGHGSVKYLTDAELSQYKVTIQNGKLYDAKGNLYDTSNANTWDGKKRAIFVIDEKGNMYASTYQKAMEFHHSSLGQGKPVAMAGEIEVTNGKLNYMSNRSGHYQPTKEFVEQSKRHLSEQGLDFSDVKINLE